MNNFLSSRTMVVNALVAAPALYSVLAMLLEKAEMVLPILGLNPAVSAVLLAVLPMVNMWLRTKTTTPLADRANHEFFTSATKLK